MVDRHTNETHFSGKLLIDQQASTHRRVIHPVLHRDPNVLCSNRCFKERIEIAGLLDAVMHKNRHVISIMTGHVLGEAAG